MAPSERPEPEIPAAWAFPTHLDRYELQARIGQGGMGTVYKAYDPTLHRLVALKAISLVDPEQRRRFQQEARAAGRLNHPHIVTVYDVGEVADLAYIVMELIEGQTLAALLPSRLPWAEAVRLLLPVCRALDAAHRQGVIHRDVKPANVLLAADGRVKLTDFGIARLEATHTLTQSGAVVGTVLYSAPEQLEGEPVDRRVDIFALGVILFELVAGQNPFVPDDSASGWARLMQAREPDFALLEDLAPPPLQAVIKRAMAEKPGGRFATAAEMDTALVALLEPTRAPAAAGPPPLPIETGSDVNLAPAERRLIAEAFRDHDRVYVESELPHPAGDARFLVVLPVRSGRVLARALVKLASPERLSREWLAYQRHVAEILPMVTGHIQGAPLLSSDRKLALLRYTFAGDVGDEQVRSLGAYYRTHPGPAVTSLLEQHLYQAVAPNWWLMRETYRFTLRQEYGRLLPVHVVLEQTAAAAEQPLVLKAGEVSAEALGRLEPGQIVQGRGFRVRAVLGRGQGVVLWALPPAGDPAETLRLQLTGAAAAPAYQPGDLVSDFTGVVVATRDRLLAQAARSAYPAAGLAGETVMLGRLLLPNPLRHYGRWLGRELMGMRSIIHGHLTLEDILVEPESGLVWLINFAETRLGHNLYDFIRLETEVVTRLMPPRWRRQSRTWPRSASLWTRPGPYTRPARPPTRLTRCCKNRTSCFARSAAWPASACWIRTIGTSTTWAWRWRCWGPCRRPAGIRPPPVWRSPGPPPPAT